jgi:hypothetical protein
MSDDNAIARLRRLALRLGKPGDADGLWFAAAVAEYTAGAAHGREFAEAFGISAGWWRDEAIERRDELLREIRRLCFPGASARAAATAIAASLERYRATAWRVDRTFMHPAKADPLRLRLHAVLKLKVPCGYSTIRSALGVANEKPAPLATASETLEIEDIIPPTDGQREPCEQRN